MALTPGTRIGLMIRKASPAALSSVLQLVVVLNWHEELKRLVPND